MKNTTFKMSWHRAFTLIELMIVIVILGILMATILPRVTGGQARARDTGRIADLSNIEQALNLYNVDYGKFPALTTKCLYPSSTAVSTGGVTTDDQTALAKLEGYLKGGKIPASTGTTFGIAAGTEGSAKCTGAYYYEGIKFRGNDQGAYILGAPMDTYQLGNAKEVDVIAVSATPTNDAALQTAIGALKKSVDDLGTAYAADSGSVGYFLFGSQ